MEILTEPTTDNNSSLKPFDAEEYKTYVEELISEQRKFFKTGITRSFEFRKQQLKKLRDLIEQNEDKINQAVYNDLKRSDFAITFTTGIAITEISYILEHVLTLKPPFITTRLKKWMNKTKRRSPLVFLGNKAYVEPVPKGVALIVGPWNYPFLLLIVPLIGAIAAGNCVIVKPSETAPETSKIVKNLINNNFDRNFIHVEEGGVEEAVVLTNNPSWDHILFTGGTQIGRIVYQAAAKNLIPVTLELGGKSPCIIDKDVHLELAVRRISSMKYLNAGQTCMAPDYLLVHKDMKEKFTSEFKKFQSKLYGDNPEDFKDFAQIINQKEVERLVPLINETGSIVFGGKFNPETKFIEPTMIDNVDVNSKLMQEEIFGPILPIIEFKDDEEVIEFIESRPHPLALYIYTKNKNFKEKILKNTNFGGAMINDSVIYYTHPEIPFGGKGESGMGNYSGKYSFDTFSQQRPVVEAGRVLDRFLERTKVKSFRYPPYKPRSSKLLKLFHRTFKRLRL